MISCWDILEFLLGFGIKPKSFRNRSSNDFFGGVEPHDHPTKTALCTQMSDSIPLSTQYIYIYTLYIDIFILYKYIYIYIYIYIIYIHTYVKPCGLCLVCTKAFLQTSLFSLMTSKWHRYCGQVFLGPNDTCLGFVWLDDAGCLRLKFNSSPLKSYRTPIGNSLKIGRAPKGNYYTNNHWKLPLTLPETNSKSTWKWMVGRRSFPFGFGALFSGYGKLPGRVSDPFTRLSLVTSNDREGHTVTAAESPG